MLVLMNFIPLNQGPNELSFYMQYIYEDQYKGKLRTLLIIASTEGNDYRIFCDGSFLGSISAAKSQDEAIIWHTDYNILKPVVKNIGAYIDSHE
jgi:hypothetical protein